MRKLDYFRSPAGRLKLYRLRQAKRLRLSLPGVEPQSKGAMPPAAKERVQGSLLRQIEHQHRRAFRGSVAASIMLSTSSATPPHLYGAIKNLLDLLGAPSFLKSGRVGLVYKDDSQIEALSVRYFVGQERAGIWAEFASLRDFAADLSLAADIQHGLVAGTEYLDFEDQAERYSSWSDLEQSGEVNEELRGWLDPNLQALLDEQHRAEVQEKTLGRIQPGNRGPRTVLR